MLDLDVRRLGHGIVVSQKFQGPAVAAGLAIQSNDTVKRLFLGAHTSQTQSQCHVVIPLIGVLFFHLQKLRILSIKKASFHFLPYHVNRNTQNVILISSASSW